MPNGESREIGVVLSKDKVSAKCRFHYSRGWREICIGKNWLTNVTDKAPKESAPNHAILSMHQIDNFFFEKLPQKIFFLQVYVRQMYSFMQFLILQ